MTCKVDESITNIMALFDATPSGNLLTHVFINGAIGVISKSV